MIGKPMLKLISVRVYELICRRVGIGRRDRLKICYPQGCMGSSPIAGSKKSILKMLFFIVLFLYMILDKLLITIEFCVQKKQITGIGPAYPAWEAGVLPLNYICISCIISHCLSHGKNFIF